MRPRYYIIFGFGGAADMKENDTDNNINEKAGKTTNWLKELVSWVVIVALAYVMAYFITHVIIIKTEIISGSMIPEMMVDDKVVGNRLSYLFSNPERGDIVFFLFPEDESRTYVKRIIGLPGDTVEIIDGAVYINGADKPLDEPYVYHPDRESFGPYEVPEDCYFMLGDNRAVSVDARYWSITYVNKDKILGKAWMRYSPSFGIIEHADYSE